MLGYENLVKKTFKRYDSLFSLGVLSVVCNHCLLEETILDVRKGIHCDSMCQFVPYSLEHDGVRYCFEWGEYPCDKCGDINEGDSLIFHLSLNILIENI